MHGTIISRVHTLGLVATATGPFPPTVTFLYACSNLVFLDSSRVHFHPSQDPIDLSPLAAQWRRVAALSILNTRQRSIDDQTRPTQNQVRSLGLVADGNHRESSRFAQP